MVAYTEVSNENLSGLYNAILDKVSQAQYIAVDCEFTGHLRGLITNLEQRYDGMAQVVRSHSILSVGLTTITADRAFDNFEFLLNNQKSYEVNANNLKFLAENGFDFNRHYSIGIPFRPGPHSFAADNNKGGSTKQKQQQQQQQEQEKQERRLRELWFDIFNILRTKNIPLIVHNGLLDLMYIYQSFITTLPATLAGFVADMVEAFPGGIYDTKYIANHVLYEQTSFLSYLYHKYERSGYQVHVQKALLPETTTNGVADPRPKKRQRKENDSSNKVDDGICDQFAARGWCAAGQACKRSHDLNRILDRDQKVNTAITKDQEPQPELAPSSAAAAAPPAEEAAQRPSLPQQSLQSKKEHSSHFDAFMTGYIFCHMATKLQGKDDVRNTINKLNVMKLDIPLRITKSTYARTTIQWRAVSQHLQNKPVPR